jgi:predicted component of type VI protein secretion system
MTSILILTHQRPDGEVDSYHLKAGRRYHFGRGSQCQVRVLDLKLSRQHCAFEYQGEAWNLIDLASTNGCTIDGRRVSGSHRLQPGTVVSAGTTDLRVESIFDSSQPRPEVAAAAFPEQGEMDPPRASDRLAAMAARSTGSSDELEPQSVPSRATISDPLIPGMPPAAPPAVVAAVPVARRDRTPVPDAIPSPVQGMDHDVLATLAPGTRAPGDSAAPPPVAAAPVDGGSRTFYINVLGKRVGPLTRAQARDLKSKELKGALTPADLALLEEQVAAVPARPMSEMSLPAMPASPPPAAGSEDQATYYVTLLGQRVGPLTRLQARELKARELAGKLTQSDIDSLATR